MAEREQGFDVLHIEVTITDVDPFSIVHGQVARIVLAV
jgi:hypothetical protein